MLATTDALPTLLAVAAAWYVQASRCLAEGLLRSSRQPMGSTRLESATSRTAGQFAHTDPCLYGDSVSSIPRSQAEAGAALAVGTYPLQLVLPCMDQLFLIPGEDGLAVGVCRFCIFVRWGRGPWHVHLRMGRCCTFLSSIAIFATLCHDGLSKDCNGLRKAGEDSKDDPHACITPLCFMLSYVIPTLLFFPFKHYWNLLSQAKYFFSFSPFNTANA